MASSSSDTQLNVVRTLGKRKNSENEEELKRTLKRPTQENETYISLSTHADHFTADPIPVNWGAEDPSVRGPICATNRHDGSRNAIGAHGGSYCVYKALAVAAGQVDTDYYPRYDLTQPAWRIRPNDNWKTPGGIVTMDPYGHVVTEAFPTYFERGYDIRPTIAVTKAHMDLAEIREWIKEGRLVPDGEILAPTGQVHISKAAVEPVWWLPGIAERMGCDEPTLRKCLFQQTNGMYPELLTRTDLKTFLPPIGGLTIYVFGDPDTIPDPEKELTVRVHDECNGSDVFGSDICTCRPYLLHAIEECIKTAQQGGCGVCIYYRKEGRSLGEVTKYLVYNLRKRQEGGDKASEYFNCTQHVAGVQDTRFQAFMPDPLLWLGITKIDKLISMSDMKYNAITAAGIEVVNRVAIPEDMVPADAQVEITAKVFGGYNGGGVYEVDKEKLDSVVGREYTGETAEGKSPEESSEEGKR